MVVSNKDLEPTHKHFGGIRTVLTVSCEAAQT